MVASEPHDDDPGWIPVPDRHVVVADALGVAVRRYRWGPRRVRRPTRRRIGRLTFAHIPVRAVTADRGTSRGAAARRP